MTGWIVKLLGDEEAPAYIGIMFLIIAAFCAGVIVGACVNGGCHA